MKLLIDTHAFVWLVRGRESDAEELPAAARASRQFC
jgi:PIN domain nuclease of toxin-antitoxin system